MPSLTINNAPVEVESGARLLDAIERAGVKVPTLCDHKALTPYGACRLCVVEVNAPGRPAAIQAACSYPALEGIAVQTHSERVLRARRIVAELLLARCPDAEKARCGLPDEHATRSSSSRRVATTRVFDRSEQVHTCPLAATLPNRVRLRQRTTWRPYSTP